MGSPKDEADDRWRDVLFELVRRAQRDDEFRARVEATGAVLDHFEAVLERVRKQREAPAGAIACRDFWWGFQLVIPHAALASWPEETESSEIVQVIGPVTGPAAPFVRRGAIYIAGHLDELQAIDRGAGVDVSMTWMAPKVFVATAR